MTFLVMHTYAQEKCATMTVFQHKLNQHPEFTYIYDSINKIIDQKAHEINNLKSLTITQIPVVVNLIGDVVINEIGPNNYLRIHQQIDILNEDYRKQAGTNGDGAGVDVGVEFCLANVDPNGVVTTGVNEITGSLGPYTSDAADEATIKGFVHWDPTQYLNIYIISGFTDGTLGYTTFPAELATNPQLDGTVISMNYFGLTTDTKYGYGRTTTHEIGHWLNLHHVWGDAPDVCSNGGVGDIPICINPYFSSEAAGCPAPTQCISQNAAAGLTDVRQIANYMDYSDDLCMSMFTQDQANIVVATLSALRPTMSGAANTNCSSTVVQPHCEDGVQDYDETGVDCGGFDCPPCTGASHCYDGIQDYDETGIDCGGADCPPCPVASHCYDNIVDDGETGVDCGGSCNPCFSLQLCSTDDPFPIHNLGDIGPSHCTWWTDDANVECLSISVNPPGGTINISSTSILVEYFLAKNSSQTTWNASNYIEIKPDPNCLGSYVEFVSSSLMDAVITPVSCAPSQIFSAYTNHCPSSSIHGSRKSNSNTFFNNYTTSNDLFIYPNPTNNAMFIETTKEYDLCTIELWNMLGARLFSETTNLNVDSPHSVDVSNFSDGAYLVLLKSNTGVVLRSIIIKQ